MTQQDTFARLLIQWQRQHGRHDLPWQNTRDPYAIWVSEIMLQQTQVSAVIPYYQRFMNSFPTIASLAAAQQEQVMQHWSGLGYYSRARNLHKAAQMVMQQHAGVFPDKIDEVQQLPGIGRSTAAAILAFAHGQRHAILDGNVKRVLTRCFGIAGWPGQSAIEANLWAVAEAQLPNHDVEPYTQGLMDLGATLCTRTQPDCGHCPLAGLCIAKRDALTAVLPTPKPRKTLPERNVAMLLLIDGHDILLEKRPPSGIWGGLWSFPEISIDQDAQQIALQQYGVETEKPEVQPVFVHTFTHFRLHITPLLLRVVAHTAEARQSGVVWLDKVDAMGAALPTAIRKLIKDLPGI